MDQLFGNLKISEISSTKFGRLNKRALSLTISDVWSGPFGRPIT
jgi:hypothetical protein